MFFVSRSSSLALIFSLSSASLSPSFSFFLSFSFSIFQIQFVDMTINLSLKYFRQQGYRNNFRFSFCLCLCFTRRGWPCNFPPKKSRVTFGLPNLLIELFYIGMPVVRTFGQAAGGRSYARRIKVKGLPGGLTYGDVTSSHYHNFSDA